MLARTTVAAVFRTAEGLGIQHVHVIESVGLMPIAGDAQKQGRRALGNVAMGASRWLSVSRYPSALACCTRLRELGVQVFASDCPPLAEDEHNQAFRKEQDFSAIPIGELPFDRGTAGSALVFGNEIRGVSRAFIEHSDAAFYLPSELSPLPSQRGHVRMHAMPMPPRAHIGPARLGSGTDTRVSCRMAAQCAA